MVILTTIQCNSYSANIDVPDNNKLSNQSQDKVKTGGVREGGGRG